VLDPGQEVGDLMFHEQGIVFCPGFLSQADDDGLFHPLDVLVSSSLSLQYLHHVKHTSEQNIIAEDEKRDEVGVK